MSDIADQKWPASTIFPDWNTKIASERPEAIAPDVYDASDESLRMQFGGHLIQRNSTSAPTTILVDAGIGAHKDRSSGSNRAWHLRRSGSFLANLARLGVRPADIQYVVVTHAHADHVGWLTSRHASGWRPTFPNAQHVFLQDELDYWITKYGRHPDTESGAIADSVIPLLDAGLVAPVRDNHTVVPGVSAQKYSGHTPGSAAVWVESHGQSAVICGDIIHHPVQLHQPLWSTRFCADPAESGQARVRLLSDALSASAILLPNHFRSAPTRVRQLAASSFARAR